MDNSESESHPDPELVEQAERVLGCVEATMYDVASGEAYKLQEMLDEHRQETINKEQSTTEE